jgi:hypothetical protein
MIRCNDFFPDPEDIEKLLEKILRIYEFFQNSENNFRITSKKFPDPEDLPILFQSPDVNDFAQHTRSCVET